MRESDRDPRVEQPISDAKAAYFFKFPCERLERELGNLNM